MTCEEAHAHAKPFLKHNLSVVDTHHYIRHIEHCKECMGDLEVAFMIDMVSGLDQGMDLPTYDLTKMFQEMVRCEKKRSSRRIFLMLAAAALAAALVILILLWFFKR